MIAATKDPTCPYDTAVHMKDVIGDAVKQFTTIEDEDHIYFSYASDQKFMDAVIEALGHVEVQDQFEFIN